MTDPTKPAIPSSLYPRISSTFEVPPPPKDLQLGIEGFTHADLFEPLRLKDLHQSFLAWLNNADSDKHRRLTRWYADANTLDTLEESTLITDIAPYVGQFLAQLFQIEKEVDESSQGLLADATVYEFRNQFAKKRVFRPLAKKAWADALEDAGQVAQCVWALAAPPKLNRDNDEERYVAEATLVVHQLEAATKQQIKEGKDLLSASDRDYLTRVHAALSTQTWTEREQTLPSLDSHEEQRDFVALLCDAIDAHLAARLNTPGDAARSWPSMRQPHKTQFDNLVQVRRHRDELPEAMVGPEADARQRVEPFALTDTRADRREVAYEVDYCIICHERDKDSCSKGLRDKQGEVKRNPLGVALNGCPLDEKISEMHMLRRQGEVIGALATVAIDNPMMPGTGHRICNDCMKGCIYQNQEPVNIPQIETRVLVDVLELPWGFEIYSLLTRWNPLNRKRPYALPYNGKKVLVVGLGPAGYTLAHYLVNEGFGVVGIDGLKLEPMPRELVRSATRPPQAIYDYTTLKQPLESRTLLGFGGVSEYGITVRWDKNFLSLIYLNLLRRKYFRAYGGIRFGGTLTLEDAWAKGFDHVAIASGAGKPTQIPLKNNLIRGIRKASDFLMAIQLTGAYKRNSLANMQVRLPAVVIGGGLTAIDTATETMAYYVVQAERALERYEKLIADSDESQVRKRFDAEELAITDELVEHGRQIRAERARAQQAGEAPRLQQLIQHWGGVSVAYRRRLQDSPAYRLNHEEISKCLEEGVQFVELMSPVEAHADEFGALESVSMQRMQRDPDTGKLSASGELERLPARSMFVAAGTHPNTSYEKEYPHTFQLDDYGYLANFAASSDDNDKVTLKPTDDKTGFFTSYQQNNHVVSYYGDNHPKYAGNVVKAMASAKDGYSHVSQLFTAHTKQLKAAEQPQREQEWLGFARELNRQLIAVVEDIKRLAPDIIEVVVRAPLAARKFEPGQFYRFQNFEAYAPRMQDGTPLLMEGLALTGAWVDKEKGLLSTIALEMGTSSRMCAMLKKGDPVILMGPTGAPTETPADETVLLAGGGLGNAVLFSIARALKERGSRVIYFAGYKFGESLFKQNEVEASTDQVIWSTDAGAEIAPRRPQDSHFRGNIVQAMLAYQKGELGEKSIDLSEVDRIIAIGSDRMMAAIKQARKEVLAPHLPRCRRAIGSINSPMQCMLKAVCAQCLQKVVDPETGEEHMIYTCFNQDQELDAVDFGHLAARLRQNSAQEKIANLWFDDLLQHNQVARV